MTIRDMAINALINIGPLNWTVMLIMMKQMMPACQVKWKKSQARI